MTSMTAQYLYRIQGLLRLLSLIQLINDSFFFIDLHNSIRSGGHQYNGLSSCELIGTVVGGVCCLEANKALDHEDESESNENDIKEPEPIQPTIMDNFDNDVISDTLEVTEISLVANNEIISIQPIITGLKDNNAIIDKSYSTKTYATQNTFSVRWEFTKPLPIHYITIITNCGDKNPSLFCGNSTLIFNTSSSQQIVNRIPYYVSNLKVLLVKYDNECDNNTLLLDTSESVDKQCNFECEQCLQYLDINLDSYIMNTSSNNNNDNCICPSYKLKLIENNKLQIWENKLQNEIGLIIKGSNLERIQIAWTKWMGKEEHCRQKYLPNIDDFMTIPSYKSIEIQETFNHINGKLYDNNNYNETKMDYFRLQIEQYLNNAFNLTWIFSISISLINNNSTNNSYKYNIYIESFDQKYSTNVIELNTLYNISHNSIKNEIINIISKSFNTNKTYIKHLYSLNNILLSPNNTCTSYFMIDNTITNAPTTHAMSTEIIIIISICAIAVLLCFIAITLLIFKKQHLACFKLEWEEKDIYQNQKDIEKNNNNTNTKQKEGETETEDIKPKNEQHIEHIKQKSIQILHNKPQHVNHGVSERVLSIPVDSIRVSKKSPKRNDVYYGTESIYPDQPSQSYSSHQYSATPEQYDTIELNKINNGNKQMNKIDDALNKAKHSNKVIEFTDFEKELKLIKIIGEGSFGKVYKAKWDAEFVAVKIFNFNSSTNPSTNVSTNGTNISQISMMSNISNHSNAIKIHSNSNINNSNTNTQTNDEQYKELYAEIVLATSIPPHPNIIRINGFCRKPLCVVLLFLY